MQLNPLDLEFWLVIVVAIACGSILGLEREIRDKPIGLRTCVLICLGTALFVQISQVLAGENTDPTRVLGQVVTGIGFLGAGVIIARGQTVVGVTTAATVWMLAAIGSLVGTGHYLSALVIAVISVAVLLGFDFVEQVIAQRKRQSRHQPRGED